jgi:hypothetical protein
MRFLIIWSILVNLMVWNIWEWIFSFKKCILELILFDISQSRDSSIVSHYFKLILILICLEKLFIALIWVLISCIDEFRFILLMRRLRTFSILEGYHESAWFNTSCWKHLIIIIKQLIEFSCDLWRWRLLLVIYSRLYFF